MTATDVGAQVQVAAVHSAGDPGLGVAHGPRGTSSIGVQPKKNLTGCSHVHEMYPGDAPRESLRVVAGLPVLENQG